MSLHGILVNKVAQLGLGRGELSIFWCILVSHFKHRQPLTHTHIEKQASSYDLSLVLSGLATSRRCNR